MLQQSAEVGTVNVLKVPNSRPPLDGPTNLSTDIERADPRPQIDTEADDMALTADALGPHIQGDHKILWFKDSDGNFLSWIETTGDNFGLKGIEFVCKGVLAENHFDETKILGINFGNKKNFWRSPIFKGDCPSYQKPRGFQSIPHAHIHLMRVNLEKQDVEQLPIASAREQYYKLHDFAGEAATQYFLPEVRQFARMFDGREAKFNIDGFERTVFEFKNLEDIVHAVTFLQHHPSSIQEKWRDLDPKTLKATLFETLPVDHQRDLDDFETYGKQYEIPCMLVAKKVDPPVMSAQPNGGLVTDWKEEPFILFPFSSGASAAEMFGGYVLEREYKP